MFDRFPLVFHRSPLWDLYHTWYTNPHLNNGDNAAFYQHMPVLTALCSGKDVVELGVRYGVSTLGILVGQPKSLISVDIVRYETIDYIEELARQNDLPWSFIEADDLTINIPECDVLFIDTLHTYEQLSQELTLHGNKAKEYIVFHDIVSFGGTDEVDTDTEQKGLLPAIHEFLENNSQWTSHAYWFNCNGLLLLKRITA